MENTNKGDIYDSNNNKNMKTFQIKRRKAQLQCTKKTLKIKRDRKQEKKYWKEDIAQSTLSRECNTVSWHPCASYVAGNP